MTLFEDDKVSTAQIAEVDAALLCGIIQDRLNAAASHFRSASGDNGLLLTSKHHEAGIRELIIARQTIDAILMSLGRKEL